MFVGEKIRFYGKIWIKTDLKMPGKPLPEARAEAAPLARKGKNSV
jgi:hypothetical protein